jgi:hypothetical protein
MESAAAPKTYAAMFSVGDHARLAYCATEDVRRHIGARGEIGFA